MGGLVLDAGALIAIDASVALLAGPGDRTAAPARVRTRGAGTVGGKAIGLGR